MAAAHPPEGVLTMGALETPNDDELIELDQSNIAWESKHAYLLSPKPSILLDPDLRDEKLSASP